MSNAKRFSRSNLIAEIERDGSRVQAEHGFDHGNGTAQLLPRGADEATKALVDRAVAYGRWRCLQGLAEHLESGHAGTTG